jgi:hypothetical protein
VTTLFPSGWLDWNQRGNPLPGASPDPSDDTAQAGEATGGCHDPPSGCQAGHPADPGPGRAERPCPGCKRNPPEPGGDHAAHTAQYGCAAGQPVRGTSMVAVERREGMSQADSILRQWRSMDAEPARRDRAGCGPTGCPAGAQPPLSPRRASPLSGPTVPTGGGWLLCSGMAFCSGMALRHPSEWLVMLREEGCFRPLKMTR